MKKYNAVISVLSVGLGCLILYLSRDLVRITEDNIPGEKFWPEIIAWLFIILGLILFITETILASKGNQKVDLSSISVRKAYLAGAISITYALLLIYIGFIPATILFIPSIMLIMGEKKVIRIILSSLVITIAIYLIFNIIFHSELPVSILIS
jgi:hypothetical protein